LAPRKAQMGQKKCQTWGLPILSWAQAWPFFCLIQAFFGIKKKLGSKEKNRAKL
jgi:hypothetical protein